MSHKRAKVLLVGPVNGRLRLLSDKLRTLQKSKAGPFDVCLCAGPFFYQTTVPSPPPPPKKVGEEDNNDDNDDDPQAKEWAASKEAALKDGKDLVDGSLSFDMPILFVDDGDGLPQGLKVDSPVEALKKDEDEIDLDEEENEDGGDDDDAEKDKDESKGSENDAKTPEGLLRVAANLYKLVGDARQNRILDGAADIIALPLPLVDPLQSTTTTTNTDAKKREHATSLTIGFLGPKVRLPCNQFSEKAKHVSFLGCDVLISGEWGQGMSSERCGALTAEDRSTIGIGNGGGVGDESGGVTGGSGSGSTPSSAEMGSYDVAELVATCRPRYHMAPGPSVPVQVGETAKFRRRFVASLPYRYPPVTSSSMGAGEGGSHAGRFLAMGTVVLPSEAKALGKAFKFIHAVGIVPLSYMDANDREAAKELKSVVDCPYTDASYGMDAAANNNNNSAGMNYYNNHAGGGGLSEARARRLAQEDAASALGGAEDQGGAFRWQQRRKRPRDGDGGDEEEAKRQAVEAANPDNCSLFLHGLHRDPGMTLTMDALMDAFRTFGCTGVRFPKPKTNRNGGHYQNQQQQQPSFAFLDFGTHDEASQCLADLKGEAVVRNVMLTLKWSSSPNKRPQFQQGVHNPTGGMGGIPPPPPPRRNRLTEAEAGDSTTLFVRLPPTLHSTAYPAELETMRLLAQGTMEAELNIGVPLDSPDRITAKDEPALRVSVRHPNADTNYGFLEFCSHPAALTTLVALTGDQDGGPIGEEKLAVSCLIAEDMTKKDISHLRGVTFFWARGGQQSKSDGNHGDSNNHGLRFNKRHFPADSRTDCWFCLASPTCEKHLIVAVYDEIYITMPKGAVNEHHVLIVPVEHGGDGAMVDRKIAPEMESIKSKLRVHARTALQKDLFVFERCIQTRGGYHPHVQVIPVETGSGAAIQSKMLEMAQRNGFQLKEITSDLGLNALEDDWSEGYFYAEIPLPGGGDQFRRFIYSASAVAGDGNNTNGGNRRGRGVPLQFGREVLAEVLENAAIAQWKACVVNKEKETEMTEEFRKSLSNVPAS